MAQVPETQRSQDSRLGPRREHPLERLQRDFDALFGHLWGGRGTQMEQDLEPLRLWDFDVKDNDKEIVVRAELPGFEEKELDVQINQDVLTIKAEKEQKDDQKEEYRSFYRSIALPPGINSEKANATYHNGVLVLHIPRAEGARPKRIEVHGEQAASQSPGASQAGKQERQAGSQAGAKAADKAQK